MKKSLPLVHNNRVVSLLKFSGDVDWRLKLIYEGLRKGRALKDSGLIAVHNFSRGNQA